MSKQESETLKIFIPAKQFDSKRGFVPPQGIEKKPGTICDQVYPTFNPLIDIAPIVAKESEEIP